MIIVKTELIFVTNITNYICGEKLSCWEILGNFGEILGHFGTFCHNLRDSCGKKLSPKSTFVEKNDKYEVWVKKIFWDIGVTKLKKKSITMNIAFIAIPTETCCRLWAGKFNKKTRPKEPNSSTIKNLITSLGLGLSVWCSFSCLSSSASLSSPGSSQGHSHSNCFVLVSAFVYLKSTLCVLVFVS